MTTRKKAKSKKKKTALSAPKASHQKRTSRKTGSSTKSASSSKAKASKIKSLIGKPLRDFDSVGTSGSRFRLSQNRGRNIVLYFYPKDSTPGCTIEGREFSALEPEFRKLNTVVFGVSRDSLKSHERFKEKECFTFELLSDEDEKICKLFDVIQMKNMYGRQILGVVRSTFLIDKDGVVRREWRGVKVAGHAKEVLSAVQELERGS